MTSPLWYLVAWLGLGIAADVFCETHAGKRKEPYKKSTQIACYIVGPIFVPLALLGALFKTILKK